MGRSGVTYDLWGSAVNLTYQLRRATSEPGIYVTAVVREMLDDSEEFVPAGTVTIGEPSSRPGDCRRTREHLGAVVLLGRRCRGRAARKPDPAHRMACGADAPRQLSARPVALVRNYLVPLGALLALLVPVAEVSAEDPMVRVIYTAFGFMLLVLLLSGLNVTFFQSAPQGSWRGRIPTIFVDVARFLLIGAGLALILSYVWGAKIGGLFTALGVTSVVIGLMLQNSVGQIVSGLFMLFEQPFRIGDWLVTPRRAVKSSK